MSSQAQEEQIIQRLKTIDQYSFEVMVNDLLHQGAFPDIANEEVSVEQFGINIEKKRTIRSAPRADAEIRLQEIKLESSVQENWTGKLKEVLQKNKGKSVRSFVFFTNQDIGTKQLSINGKTVDAEEYVTAELGCEKSWIIGQKDLILRMQNPKYFSIRRNCLSILADFFCSAREYSEILGKNTSLKCETDQSDLERYAIMLKDRLSFDPSSVVLLHNDDFITLLHTVALWAVNSMKEHSQDVDFCFIRWPWKNADIASVDGNEVDGQIQTFIVVWGANDIDNLSDFLCFAAENVTMVFVTPTSFKETVQGRLESSRENIHAEEVYIGDIDKRLVGPDEKAKHQEKIKTVVLELLDLMLRFEALVYFYSPFNLDDQQKIDKVMAVLHIDNAKLSQLKELLIKSDLAAITGRILWLKQPVVAKELLNDFINTDAISVGSLVMEI